MARARKRAVLAIIAACIVAAMIWATHQSAERNDGDAAERGALAAARGSQRPLHEIPRWLGARNTGMRRIAGVVLFDGAPVAGAAVRLASILSSSDAVGEPTLQTDASGRFDFGPQLAISYLVAAEKPHLAAAVVRLDLRDQAASTDELHLVLHACDASIHGTITDVSSGPIPRARVVYSADSIATGAGATADDHGNYELCVPVDTSEVTVKADGYAQLTAWVQANGPLRRDFSLMPEAVVVGRVVRASDRSPVVGALVKLDPDSDSYSPARYVSSDRDGRFRFDGLAPGRHAVTATSDRLASAQPTPAIAEVGRARDEIVCALVATHTISGHVVERENREPVGGVTIALAALTRASLSAVSQADGSFVIDHALEGRYEPIVDGIERERQPAAITVANADIDGVVFEVEPRSTISGRITHGGKPVDGASVGAGGSTSSTSSDHDGRYTLRGVPPGTYSIYAESKRIGAFTKGPTITVGKREQKTGIDIEMELEGSISGVVVDQNGAPVRGVVVSFSLLNDGDGVVATTADNGTFTARAMAGGGEYVLQVRPADRFALSYRPAVGKRFPAIALRDGQTHVTGVRIQVQVEHLSISGRVVDTGGVGLPDVIVGAATNGERDRGPAATTATDGNGAFTIRDLPAGKYYLVATSPRGAVHVDDVPAGREGLVVQLASAGSIEGTLDGFARVPDVQVFGVAGVFQAAVDGDRFSVRDVLPGDYSVRASTPEGVASARLKVVSDSTATVVLRHSNYGAIVGTIVDGATGKPIPGARCMCTSAEWMNSEPLATDATGGFRIEHVAAGTASVSCWSPQARAEGSVQVIAGETARLDLAARVQARQHGTIGAKLRSYLDTVAVESVVPDGPAARSGILRGDVLLEIDDADAPTSAWEASARIERRPIGSLVKLKLERAQQEVVVQVVVEAAQ